MNAPTFLYELVDGAGRLLYVGITDNLNKRVVQHRNRQPWGGEIQTIRAHIHDTRIDARAAERELIASAMPLHNVNDAPTACRAPQGGRVAEVRRALTELGPSTALEVIGYLAAHDSATGPMHTSVRTVFGRLASRGEVQIVGSKPSAYGPPANVYALVGSVGAGTLGAAARQALVGARPPELPPEDPRHGRVTTYSNWFCRCVKCTEANKAASAEARRKRSAAA